jgi:hypothetical protein
MTKKPFVPARIAPLQRIVAEPITDPVELAAIDKMRKRLKQKQRIQEAATSRNGGRTNTSRPASRKKA